MFAFSLFVQLQILSLSKATQRTQCGFIKQGLRVYVPPAQAFLVLHITNEEDNTTFSLILTLEIWQFSSIQQR